MYQDVIEAVHLMYEDDHEMEALCYVYIQDTTKDNMMFCACRDRLEEMGRCPNCGTVMKSYHQHTYHSEVDAYENYVVQCCPMCDVDERGVLIND